MTTRGRKPQINPSPLAGRFSIGKEPDPGPDPAQAEATAAGLEPEPEPAPAEPPAADPGLEPEPPEPDPAPAEPQEALSAQTPRRGTGQRPRETPRRSPRETPRNPPRQTDRSLGKDLGNPLGEDLGDQAGVSISAARLRRRRRDNPWRNPAPLNADIPAFLREYLRTSVALTGGEEKLKDLVTDAVTLLAAHRGEEELLEDAWQGEGGQPGMREQMRPW